MCVTTSKSEMDSTIIGTIIDFHTEKHYLFYQNIKKNLSDGMNCMIIPILGNQITLHDTTEYKNFAKDIQKRNKEIRDRNMRSSKNMLPIVNVGSYKVITVEDASLSEIKETLNSIENAPVISDELINFYLERYNKATLLFCLFDNKKEDEAEPIMIEYYPYDFEKYLIPLLDAHDGNIPVVGNLVDRNHEIISCYIAYGDNDYFQFNHKVPPFLENARISERSLVFEGNYKNHDIIATLIDRGGNGWSGKNF